MGSCHAAHARLMSRLKWPSCFNHVLELQAHTTVPSPQGELKLTATLVSVCHVLLYTINVKIWLIQWQENHGKKCNPQQKQVLSLLRQSFSV